MFFVRSVTALPSQDGVNGFLYSPLGTPVELSIVSPFLYDRLVV